MINSKADGSIVVGNSTNHIRIHSGDWNNPDAEALTNGGSTISWIEFIEKNTLIVVCFNNDKIEVYP